ncbi:tyrosyl-DNA phosphodiesterase-domain-containing protein [Mycena galericulata]|nr:tyrosyl-DNA phosphodiesterase-domain-containing protein [Mycena galericulata]
MSLQDSTPTLRAGPIPSSPKLLVTVRRNSPESVAGGSKKRLPDFPDNLEHLKKKPKLDKESKNAKVKEKLRKLREEKERKALNPVKLPMKYKGGALRLTRTPGRGRMNTVSLGDLIHPNELSSAFVFAYFIEPGVLFKHFPFKTSQNHRNHCLVYVGTAFEMDMFAKGFANIAMDQRPRSRDEFDKAVEAAKKGYSEEYGENFKAFYPYMSGGGCAHSKMMILIYPDFLRLVITSANLMATDVVYGDNMWYIEDFPRLSPQAAKIYTKTEFETGLGEHLKDLQCPPEFLSMYLETPVFDFSAVKVHLVTSVPGSFSKERATAYGQLALRRIVRDNILQDYTEDTLPKMEFEVCVGSVGHLETKGVVNNLLQSCAGDLQESFEGAPALKMVFPTLNDVKKSSKIGAGNIASHITWSSLEKKSAEYLKGIFYHYKSKDEGCLFHMKSILALRAGHPKDLPLYIYMGSHNFSINAWGKVAPEKRSAERAKFGPVRLEGISNLECGVVVPGKHIVGMLETKDWEDFVPYVRPSEANRYRDGEKPFVRLVEHVDIGGSQGLGGVSGEGLPSLLDLLSMLSTAGFSIVPL